MRLYARFYLWIGVISLLCCLSRLERADAQGTSNAARRPDASQEPIATDPRILDDCPVRLGGVYTSGLSGGPTLVTAGNTRGKLSLENLQWIAANCDVIALSPADIEPDTFPAINRLQKLFTPLLYVYASHLFETDHRGSVGGWRPEMREWVLRGADGKEVPYPEAGGHWMDFDNPEWAAHWSERVKALTQQYGAYGAVAAELPLGNTFTGANLLKYHSNADRARATKQWLAAARPGYPNLLIPSALGFDLAAGHPTPELKTGLVAPALAVRLWDDYFPLTDGAWCEGWVQPYWTARPLAESLWETQMQAADRAGRLGQVFIATCAYRNARELEFALASYLLVVHHQGRVVFQPMPVQPGQPADAGFSLAVLKRELRARPGYFRIPLGVGLQERHQFPVEGGVVWRRNFQNGDVYVNSDEHKTISILFAGKMRRLDGSIVSAVTLPPHSGAVLLYATGIKTAPQPSHPNLNGHGGSRKRSKQ